MILAVDVDYREDRAVVGGILFHGWHDVEPAEEIVVTCTDAADYVPGQFYRRELPCIEALLQQVEEEIECIVIDGYVYLGKEGKPGLGKYLHEALNEDVIVIGVAKSVFKGTPKSAELLRGSSRRPLYVTAAGIELDKAKHFIQHMYGEDRVPALLKRVDRLCRDSK